MLVFVVGLAVLAGLFFGLVALLGFPKHAHEDLAVLEIA